MPRKSKETLEKEIKTTKETTKKAAISKNKAPSKINPKIKKVTKTKTKPKTEPKVKSNMKKELKSKDTVAKTSNREKKSATKELGKNKKEEVIKKDKKVTTKKTTSKSDTTSKTKTTKKASTKKISKVEYYDLPFRYNQTIVKVLAQTPKSLFVYWDISDEDRKNYVKSFGDDFFNNTIPFLRIKNNTLNYSFDVDVDDFANGWYIQVSDANSNYSVDLLRKQKPFTNKVIDNDIYVTYSNMDTPNDHILFEKEQKMLYYRNIKTGEEFCRDFTSLWLIRNMGRIYNIYDMYKKIYGTEDISEHDILSNPSS